jgi:tryptophan synthase alpha chain
MSKKLTDAFGGGKAFIGFVTGGDGGLKKTEEFVVAMAQEGADIVEIGVPFSDPIAEGEVIQRANIRALKHGVNLNKLFGCVKNIRKRTEAPLVFLTYLNPVFRYGYDAFFAECARAGVDGVIIPDLPFEERGELAGAAAANEVDVISLIAPTSEARIAQIARAATGFVYVVSSMGVTGVRSEITTDLNQILRVIKSAANVPAAVGFGVSEPEQAEKIARIADGVIVGSAIVKIIEKHGGAATEHLREYVRSMKAAVKRAEGK